MDGRQQPLPAGTLRTMHLSDNATLRGLVWMIACGVLFSALNMLQKLLAYQLHPPQVTCLRYFVGSLLLVPSSVRAAGRAIGRAGRRCMSGAASSMSRVR